MENNRFEKHNNSRSSYLGNLIKELVDAGGFTVNDVATYIDVSEEELEIIYDSNSIDVENSSNYQNFFNTISSFITWIIK